MYKDYYDLCLSVLIRITQIDERELFKSNKEEIASLRKMFIKLLCEKYTDIEISRFTGFTRQCINRIRHDVKMRLWSVCNIENLMRKELETYIK